MKIVDVLNKKGRTYHKIAAGGTVGKAMELFVRYRIGSLVVVNADDIGVGLVTERSLIESLAKDGPRILWERAGTIMIAPVPACKLDHDVRAALAIMTELRTRYLVVLGEGKTHGIVSIGDLVKHKLADTELENLVLRDMVGARQFNLDQQAPVYPGRQT